MKKVMAHYYEVSSWPRVYVWSLESAMRYLCQLTAVLLLISVPLEAQTGIPPSIYEQITTAFKAGEYQKAEQQLKQILENHPRDVRAMSLLGAVLDSQKKYEEAETVYQQALKLAPGSASLNNNVGNHFLARGMTDQARSAFLRVIAAEPRHVNANLQLADLSVKKKKGQEALVYLGRLPEAEQSAVPIQILKAQALYWAGQKSQADSLIQEILKQAPGDPRLAFSLGIAYVAMERYAEAEKAFNLALEAAPTSFDILINLGLAADRAGHLNRAEEVFQAALKQRPEEVDALVGLARVYAEKGDHASAIVLLVKARKLAPDRGEILLSLADSSEKLNFYGDQARAYDDYLKLRPNDDVVRRERGYARVRNGWRATLEEGLKDLEWYVQKHPEDPLGFYQLAVGESLRDREHDGDRALLHINQALKLDTHLREARLARGMFLVQQGRPSEAIADLQLFLEQQPNNPQALGQLGRAYLQLGRTQEAYRVLKQATDLAPEDVNILVQYSRALRKLGRNVDLEQVLARLQTLGDAKKPHSPQASFYDYLNLPPQEQQVRYVANLRQMVLQFPSDMSLRVRLGGALLQQGQVDEALKEFDEVRASSTDAANLVESARILVNFEKYQAARPFLEDLVAADSANVEVRMNLAIVKLHLEGPRAGLDELERIPLTSRNGDVFLLQAQILDALDLPAEASQSLNRALEKAPTRYDLYFQAALFLIKHYSYDQAQKLLVQALKLFPDAPELLVVQAITLNLSKQPEEAKESLTRLQSRWPEWDFPYVVHGSILEVQQRSEEARPLLENAVALGTTDPSAYYYLAQSILHSTPDDREEFDRVISKAFQLSPDDPYLHTLAGRFAYAHQDYQAALMHLMTAIKLKPDLDNAHYLLSATYQVLGEDEKSKTEMAEARRLQEGNLQDADTTLSIRSLLFTVSPPTVKPQP
ncbi:MAG TPA: tetratricopeptide repeat protein [Terriglobia bacterium]|nr:tetratricopeptide repeat protein [Terriglobia bacterium]